MSRKNRHSKIRAKRATTTTLQKHCQEKKDGQITAKKVPNTTLQKLWKEKKNA